MSSRQESGGSREPVSLSRLRTRYIKAQEHLAGLARVAAAEDPSQEQPLINDLWADYAALRELANGFADPMELRNPVPLIHKGDEENKIPWYDPVTGTVYQVQTLIDRGHINGDFHFEQTGEPEPMPFEAWIRNPGLRTRVFDAVISPVSKYVRKMAGMPDKRPVHL
jgi:hypothetical protein